MGEADSCVMKGLVGPAAVTRLGSRATITRLRNDCTTTTRDITAFCSAATASTAESAPGMEA